MPLAWDFNRQRDGIDFREAELLEWSIRRGRTRRAEAGISA